MIDAFMTSPVVCGLGWAVLHFLWQGCVIVGIAALFLRYLRDWPAQTRYAVGCAALASSLVIFVATFAMEIPDDGAAVAGLILVSSMTEMSATIQADQLMIPSVACLWCVGVIWLLMRFTVQWTTVSRLKRIGTTEVTGQLRSHFDTLCRNLGLDHPVRFLQSTRIDAPMIIGWMSPVVVVPVSALTSLPPDQLRAILAHEIAHIRRYDYLLNGFQNLIEIVLFFHPAVWWLSGQVRHEREQCCDDVAVRTTGSAIVLARALSHLETLREQQLQLALAANGGKLMNRIERILGIKTTTPHVAGNWRILPILLVAVLTAGVVYAAATNNETKDVVNPQLLAIQQAVEEDTMTEQQAWTEYFKSVYPGSEQEKKIQFEYEDALKWIRILEEDGRITKEHADEKRQIMQKQRDSQMRTAFAMCVLKVPAAEAYVDSQRILLEEMVRSGKITQEEMARKLEMIRRHAVAEQKYLEKLEEVIANLDAQVEAGNMTREAADTQIEVVKQEFQKKISYHLASLQIKAKVEEGKLTQEEADLELLGLLVDYFGEDALDWDGIKKRIESAVEKGEMTREEADAKYAEIQRSFKERQKNRQEMDWAEIEKRLKEAVNRGELTHEEAEEKYRALRAKKAEKTAPAKSGNSK